MKDIGGDQRADIVAGAGEGAQSVFTAYLGQSIPANGTPRSTRCTWSSRPTSWAGCSSDDARQCIFIAAVYDSQTGEIRFLRWSK